MGLRLVEMQVALPRTQDVGKMQEQMQQKGQHLQEHLASMQNKEDEIKSKQVYKKDEPTKNQLQKDGQGSNKEELPQRRHKNTSNTNQNEKLHHPYKGNLIDIEG
ncbi:hypothetical protein [Calidifontibacillus oryziterrae]|uniref:hypothetical protein n=1 Tax=Calidifontibacillus oryziterrae TaxID=1191699 RepID=UPI0002EE1FE1|nr:hypothetical protein [Calidifontibacillus oryziterrae]